MIDIENAVINAVYEVMKVEHPDVMVSSGHPRKPEQFPTVQIYEASNKAYHDTIGSDHIERHANLIYSVVVYVNDLYGKREHAKTIMKTVDECLTKLGMYRTMSEYYFDTNESTIYSLTTGYACLAGESPSGSENEIMIYGR